MRVFRASTSTYYQQSNPRKEGLVDFHNKKSPKTKHPETRRNVYVLISSIFSACRGEGKKKKGLQLITVRKSLTSPD